MFNNVQYYSLRYRAKWAKLLSYYSLRFLYSSLLLLTPPLSPHLLAPLFASWTAACNDVINAPGVARRRQATSLTMIFTDHRIITDLTSHSAIQCQGYHAASSCSINSGRMMGGMVVCTAAACAYRRQCKSYLVKWCEMFIHGPRPGIVVLLCLRLESLDLCFQPGAVWPSHLAERAILVLELVLGTGSSICWLDSRSKIYSENTNPECEESSTELRTVWSISPFWPTQFTRNKCCCRSIKTIYNWRSKAVCGFSLAKTILP